MDVGLILNEEVLKGWVADIEGISLRVVEPTPTIRGYYEISLLPDIASVGELGKLLRYYPATSIKLKDGFMYIRLAWSTPAVIMEVNKRNNLVQLLIGSVLARCKANLDEVTVDTLKVSKSLSVQRICLKDKITMYYNDPVDVLRDSTTNLPVEIQCYLKVGDVVVVDKGLVCNENTSIFLTLLQLVYLTVLALYEQYESDIMFESLADKVARALEQ